MPLHDFSRKHGKVAEMLLKKNAFEHRVDKIIIPLKGGHVVVATREVAKAAIKEKLDQICQPI